MKILSQYLSLSAILLLTACGGGGSDGGGTIGSSSSAAVSSSSSSSSEPVAAPENAPEGLTLQLHAIKQFRFQWEMVESADYYQLYENVDGASGFTLIADNLETTEYQMEVPLYLRTQASYMVQACNVGGCSAASESASVSGNMAEAVGYIKAPMTLGSIMIEGQEWPVGQYFGGLALSGDGSTLAVATLNDLGGDAHTDSDAETRFEEGGPAVFVYRKGEAGWELIGKIGGLSDTVSSLELTHDGERLALGMANEDGGSTGINGDESDQSSPMSGAVYVFRLGDTWQQEAYLKASNAESYDQFGGELAFSSDGTTLAVGAEGERSASAGVNGDETNDEDMYAQGAAYLFYFSEETWTQQAYIKATDNEARLRPNQFGRSMDFAENGSTLAVGATGWAYLGDGDDATVYYSAVYLYHKDGEGQWQTGAKVVSPDPVLGSKFGSSVALSHDGTLLAVGESHRFLPAQHPFAQPELEGQGKVHLFGGEQWNLQATLIPENGIKPNRFGSEIALTDSGDHLVVCAPFDNSDSVALEDDTGAEALEESGAAYVFTRHGDVWQQTAFINSPNPDTDDWFCGSLGMSATGDVLAVGASGEGGSATDIGGEFDNNAEDAGAVYLY